MNVVVISTKGSIYHPLGESVLYENVESIISGREDNVVKLKFNKSDASVMVNLESYRVEII